MNKEQFEKWQTYIQQCKAYRDKIEASESNKYSKNLIEQQRKKPENIAMITALHVWESFLGTERKLP